MSFTVFLGNLPTWVTADDIKAWLTAENLVADAVKVIRNHETQESKGFAFVEAPTSDEMQAIIRRFDRAPLEDRILRANPAQPTRPKTPFRPMTGQVVAEQPIAGQPVAGQPVAAQPVAVADRGSQRRDRKKKRETNKSAFATELANSLRRH